MHTRMSADRFLVSPILLSLTLILLLTGCVAPAVLAPVGIPPLASAQLPASAAPNQTIVVVGNGNTRVQANLAQVNLGIEVVDDTVLAANRTATETMDRVLDALASQRIAGDDIQPYAYTIYAERDYPDYDIDDPGTVPLFPEANQPIHFRVIHQIHALIHELDNVPNVVDAVTKAGGADVYIYGTDFLYDDPESLEITARQTAIADARGKAAEIAQLLGVELGPTIAISEFVQGSGVLWDNNYVTLLWPGQLQFYMQLQITYATGNAIKSDAPPISAASTLSVTDAITNP